MEIVFFGHLSFGIDDQVVASHRLASSLTAFDRKADEQRAQAFSSPTQISSQSTHLKTGDGLGGKRPGIGGLEVGNDYFCRS